MRLMCDGRYAEIEEIEGEVGEGAYAMAGYWEDTGEILTDRELETISDGHQSELYQHFYEHKASAAYDYYKDQMKYGD